MFVMSCILIVDFHPHLNLRKIIVQISYEYSLEQLTTTEMSFIDITLVKLLIDIAQEVSQRKCKNASGQVFTIETDFIKKTLLEWFNKKSKC